MDNMPIRPMWREEQTPKLVPWRQRYNEYLASPEWKRKRSEVLRSAVYQCEVCGAKGRLSVHHLHYETLGNESSADLIALCDGCHDFADAFREAKPDLDVVQQACAREWKTFNEIMTQRQGRGWWVTLSERSIVFRFMAVTGFLAWVKHIEREATVT